MVSISVGPHEKKFDVHKELLCSVSDFFSAALNGGFKEAEAGAVKLPEQDPDTFQYFVHWLYAGKLTGYFRAGTSPSLEELNVAAIAEREAQKITTDSPEKIDAIYEASDALNLAIFEEAPIPALVSLYVLADALQVRGLRDHIVITIIKVYAIDNDRANFFWYRPRAIDSLSEPIMIMNNAYKQLPSSSTLRRFIIELYLRFVGENAFAPKRGLLDSDFIFDYLIAVQDLWYLDDYTRDFQDAEIICDHHVHDVKCLLARRSIFDTDVWEW